VVIRREFQVADLFDAVAELRQHSMPQLPRT
jgi:hypothetical protein